MNLMRDNFVHRVMSISVITCLFAASLALANPAELKDRSSLPINIKSNELVTDNKGKTAIFTGKVVAKQGNVTIFSDKLIVYYGENQGEVDKIEADGNVRIVQENRTGLSAHAVYESKEGRITLTGNNPRVSQGTDVVTGKIITYYIDEDRSVASGGGDSRVEAIIHPQEKNSKPKKQKSNDGSR
jgi:lipopolysaccharide export system protein LptA